MEKPLEPHQLTPTRGRSYSIAGGSQKLDRTAAEKAVDIQVAGPLGMSRLEAAYGIHRLANTNMSQAIRGVSIERGRDPRNFMLVAFGGAGPMHAALIARHFEVERVVVPASPGLFCAIGLQVADLRHDYVASYELPNDPESELVSNLFEQLEDRAQRFVSASGLSVGDLTIERFVDQRYRGQAHELSVPVPGVGASIRAIYTTPVKTSTWPMNSPTGIRRRQSPFS